MERLWSPWRSKYISSFKDEPKEKESCFFCDSVNQGTTDEENLVVHISINTFVIMNRYPYNNGHLLIAPKRHISELRELTDSELLELIQLQKLSSLVLTEIYKPHGFNIGANLGRAAGAGIPGHLHYHILPRWNGDTNFLPIISETKVLSETLEDSFKKISNAFRIFSK